MNSDDRRSNGPAMHDRIIGALETCCRQGEMLRIQNRDVNWTQHQILIRAENAKDNETRSKSPLRLLAQPISGAVRVSWPGSSRFRRRGTHSSSRTRKGEKGLFGFL